MIAAGITDRDQRWQRFEDEVAAELRPLDPDQRRAALKRKIDEESRQASKTAGRTMNGAPSLFPRQFPGSPTPPTPALTP